MRALVYRILALLLVLPALAGPAQAECDFWFAPCSQNIDDFLQGAFQPAPPGFDFTQANAHPKHVLSTTRRTVIDATEGHTAGMVALGGGNNGFVIQTENQGSSPVVFDPDVLLEYPFDEPFDLTYGGKNDRIVVDVLEADQMQLTLRFHSQGSSVASTLLLQPGPNVFYLSDVNAFLNVNAIDKLGFYFNEYAQDHQASVRISAIRLTGTNRLAALLDLPILVQQFPPFDDPGPLMETSYYEEEFGTTVPTLGVAMRVEKAAVLDPNDREIGQFPMLMNLGDDGGSELGGSVAGYEFFESVTGKASFDGGRFDLRFLTDSTGDFGIGIGEVAGIDPSPFSPRDYFAEMVVPLLDFTGRIVSYQTLRMNLRIPEGAPYQLREAFVEPLSNFEFALMFEIEPAAGKPLDLGKADGDPLFHITFEGEVVRNAVSTAAPVVGSATLGLGAYPSVTSGRTTLRLSRPLNRTAEVRVFDLAGRLVRRLPVERGITGLSWDTRDANGRPVASGVYLARVQDGAQQASQKVTVVR